MADSDEFVEKHCWMVRPCHLYDEEYSDCTAIRSRLYQNFIFGKLNNCSQWSHDYRNCTKWTEEQDKKAFKELIESELKRRNERLIGHINNDVWEKRTGPPPGWNDPLPEHIAKRLENSYLAAKINNIKEGSSESGSSLCVIS